MQLTQWRSVMNFQFSPNIFFFLTNCLLILLIFVNCYHALCSGHYVRILKNHGNSWWVNGERLSKTGIQSCLLECNELDRGNSTFFCQSQDEFRTKESDFVSFGLITNEGQIRLGIEGTPNGILLFCTHLAIGIKTLCGPGWVRYTVN